MTDSPESDERRHAQDPAEGGDTDAEETPETARSHAEEPSEGADAKGGPEDRPAHDAGSGGSRQKP